MVPRTLLLPLLSLSALSFQALACGEPAGPVVPPAVDARPAPRSTTLPPPVEHAPDPDPVTAENLYEKERYWPYRVSLVESFQPAGGEKLVQRNRIGVLIRVEPSGNPRIDFGHFGNWEVPVEKTDVVEQANRVRLGEERKDAPNFTYAIRTRILSSRDEEQIAQEDVFWSASKEAFLCVFADPLAEGFDALASSLVELSDRDPVGTIFFPQGQVPDPVVHARIRQLGWEVPFLADFLSEAYTETVLPEEKELPRVMLQTAEGRVLYEGLLRADTAAALRVAIDATFGTRSTDSEKHVNNVRGSGI